MFPNLKNSSNQNIKMESFGAYIREKWEALGLPLRKVAPKLDVNTSILSKIGRNKRKATIEMLPILSQSLGINEKKLQEEFIKDFVLSNLNDLIY